MALKEEAESEWRSVRGKVFQTEGPAKEKDLSLNDFVFTQGVTKVRVSDADCNWTYNAVLRHQDGTSRQTITFQADSPLQGCHRQPSQFGHLFFFGCFS